MLNSKFRQFIPEITPKGQERNGVVAGRGGIMLKFFKDRKTNNINPGEIDIAEVEIDDTIEKRTAAGTAVEGEEQKGSDTDIKGNDLRWKNRCPQ